MSEESLRDMDKTKQPSGADATASSNTVRPVKHCDCCGCDYSYDSKIVEEDNGMSTSSHPVPDDDSESHVLENDEEAMATEVDGLEKWRSYVKIGLAAVRIRVGNAHLRGHDAKTADLSGFRLSGDVVITCAHFTNWDSAANDVEFFLNGKNGVCEAIQARGFEEGVPKNCLTLRLWAIHKAWNIAVFRITDWPQNDSKDYVVKKEDIYLLTPEERHHLKTSSSARLWSAGYNPIVNLDEDRKQSKDFHSRRRGNEKTEIAHGSNSNEARPPGPESLEVNTRTANPGMKIGRPHGAKEHQESAELSTCSGRSGSMVCTEKDGSSVVVGMAQGGSQESDYNYILFFNTEIREWLYAATDLRASSDPQEISRRIVMA